MTTILLIDLSSIAHPLFHISASDPDPNATSIKIVERVRALASGQPYVAVCCDSGRSFRKDISAEYKANRPPADATLQHQIALAMETLTNDGFPVWAVTGFEADDLIASACVKALHIVAVTTIIDDEQNMRGGPMVTIASADKDLLQLVSDRVVVKSLRDGNLIDEDGVFAKLGVKPHQVLDYLALVGDASDNIKGANNIGEKKAAALLGAFGNLDDLYAAMDTGDAAMQPATVKALTEFRPRMETVRSLIALRMDAPIPFEDVFKERIPNDRARFNDEEPMINATDSATHQATVQSEPQASVDPLSPRAEQKSEHGAVLMAQPPSTEFLPPPFTEFNLQLEPRSLRESALLAQEMFKSRLFSAYGTYQGVLATILAGRELGMQAMASLRAFHIIDGKPTLSADLIRALCLKSPACEYFRCTERANDKATWQTKRKGEEPQSLTFTIEDAKLAWAKDEKAWKASGWGKNPADMCVARASAKLARLVYADVVFNLYAPEEIEER